MNCKGLKSALEFDFKKYFPNLYSGLLSLQEQSLKLRYQEVSNTEINRTIKKVNYLTHINILKAQKSVQIGPQ